MCLHKITSKDAYFVCRCCVCCAHLRIRRERKETRKERQKRAALCSRLISLTSHVRDGKAFLRQVLDSRWVKRGLGRSQWSRPILTRRHNGARATKGSSDFQFLFSSHVLHLSGYLPGEAEPSRDGMRAAWVSQSHLASVVLKIKRPYR